MKSTLLHSAGPLLLLLLLTGCVGPASHVATNSHWLVPRTGYASVAVPPVPSLSTKHPYRIVVYGDCRGDHPEHRAVVEAIRTEHPDLVVFTGDAVECFPVGHMPDLGVGGYFIPFWPQYLRGYPLFSLFTLVPFPQVMHEVVFSPFYPIRDPEGFNGFLEDTYDLRVKDRVPFVLVPGNHDLYHRFDRLQVARLFGEPGGGGERDVRRLWFAVDLPGVRLIVADTGDDLLGDPDPLAAGTGQVAWIRREILHAKKRGLTPLVTFHLPAFSSAAEDGPVPAVREELVRPVLDPLAVPLVLNGHAHAYERIEHRRPDGGTTTYVITGGGGAPFHHEVAPPDRDPGSKIFVARTLHYVVLDVFPDRITGTVRSVKFPGTAGTGSVIDRFVVPRDGSASAIHRPARRRKARSLRQASR